ncbi:MAG: aspartate/glutamate racemase family protein [Gammaproteobacteria bacterium]|nr:aspartate/glutamate racemase family protein [Gammaproteobacteria bacterium]
MKIGVVLPTSDPELLAGRQALYAGWARPGTEISVRLLDKRVPAEADPSDSFVLPEILHQIVEAEQDTADAVIVDCMEDPGVEEGRRLVNIPVIGPGHAAMNLASVLGYKFSILYPLQQTILIERLVVHHQLSSMLASIRYLSCGLEGIRSSDSTTLKVLEETAITAIIEDGAHVIIPACTLTSHLVQQLQERLHEKDYPVPVVDGPSAAVKLAQALVDLDLSPSRVTYPGPLGISRRIA